MYVYSTTAKIKSRSLASLLILKSKALELHFTDVYAFCQEVFHKNIYRKVLTLVIDGIEC